jgi:serine/threonine protein kinase
MYLAPEVIMGDEKSRVYSQASDSYAYGISIWELMEEQYPDLAKQHGKLAGPSSRAIIKCMEEGHRLAMSEGLPLWARHLITACTDMLPNRRPKLATVVSKLEEVAKDVQRWV